MSNTVMSSLLKSRINNSNPTNHDNASHDKIYNDLKSHANDVRPNEPKAKLIRQTLTEKFTDPIKDTFNDSKNFFKAVGTGKLNDNSIGRINDLGMKIGALIIASYLATRPGTKTNALMQFIGGTTFFASMALWPKLFINLPARLVHGFRIDHRYISAQGDKKDLGLDNQFQPMDIFSDEEMLAMAKKAGIDPKDPRAKEKMQRKLQKTMLQNRTLWMATAGFATPLLTSMVGNFAEPKVVDAVIKHGYEKTKTQFSSIPKLKEYMDATKGITRNIKEVSNLFENVQNGAIDKEFYQRLTGLLSIDDVFKSFSDVDDIKPIAALKPNNLVSVLQSTREELSTTTETDLKQALNTITTTLENNNSKTIASSIASRLKVAGTDAVESILKEEGITDKSVVDAIKNHVQSGKIRDAKKAISDALCAGNKGVSESVFSSIVEQLNGDFSLKNVRRVLEKSKITDKNVETVMSHIKADNSKFADAIKDYNKNALPQLRGRLKGYLKLVNNMVGAKRESVYTKEYLDTMKEVLGQFNITDPKEIKTVAKGGVSDIQELLIKKLSENYPEKGSYIKAFIPKPANNAAGYSFKNYLLQCLDTADSIEGRIKNVFGEGFIAAEGKDSMHNFMAYITSANEDWINPITEKSLTHKFKSFINSFAGNKQTTEEYLKNSLTSSFGEDCCFVQDESMLKNLAKEIREGKENWINRLTDEFKAHLNQDSSAYKNQKSNIKELAKEIEDARSKVIPGISKFFGGLNENDAKGKLKEIYNTGKDSVDNLLSTSLNFTYATRADGVEQLVDKMIEKENLAQISDISNPLKRLTRAILGGEGKGSLDNVISEYVRLQRLNLSSTKLKAIALANFEERLRTGQLEGIDQSMIKAARQLLTDGEISQWYNNCNLPKEEAFKNLVNLVYNPEAFNQEELNCPGIKAVIKDLQKTLENKNVKFTEKYLKTGSLANRLKDCAKSIFENRNWLKIFGTMTVILIVVTLLVQPLFGKIDKEFPENDKKGVMA